MLFEIDTSFDFREDSNGCDPGTSSKMLRDFLSLIEYLDICNLGLSAIKPTNVKTILQ